MPRTSKYRVMAEELYSKAGFTVTQKADQRITKIKDFLSKNYRNANKAFITTNVTKATNARKHALVGRTGAPAGGNNYKLYVAYN